MTDHVNDDGPADERLRELLDSSFGDGPVPPTPADRLVPARRALRRRRWTQAGGAVVATAAAVTAVAALSGGGSPSTRDVGPAGPGPVATQSATPTPGAECARPSLPDPPPAFEPGVEPDPLDEQFLQVDPAEGQGDVPAVPDDAPTAGACVEADEAGEVPAFEVEPVPSDSGPLPGESDLVRFASPTGEELAARADVVILEQTGDVVLPERFAGPDDRTAVAKVSVDGRVVYVLARQVDGGREEYIATPDRRDRWATTDDFLAYAAGRYTPDESGGSEGLR